jgi:hypothetical protein
MNLSFAVQGKHRSKLIELLGLVTNILFRTDIDHGERQLIKTSFSLAVGQSRIRAGEYSLR